MNPVRAVKPLYGERSRHRLYVAGANRAVYDPLALLMGGRYIAIDSAPGDECHEWMLRTQRSILPGSM
ncbi:MAG: hypothetical protein JRI27_10595 [Deltaproteobacteria bacterium]|nr:hypothetical protein [Deltaproteobacteria bacterium]